MNSTASFTQKLISLLLIVYMGGLLPVSGMQMCITRSAISNDSQGNAFQLTRSTYVFLALRDMVTQATSLIQASLSQTPQITTQFFMPDSGPLYVLLKFFCFMDTSFPSLALGSFDRVWDNSLTMESADLPLPEHPPSA